MKTVVILILIYIAYRVLKRLFYFRVIHHHPNNPGGHGPAGSADEDMVLDPVCGSYVPVHTAVTLDSGGVRRHFCSTDCRDKFLSTDHG